MSRVLTILAPMVFLAGVLVPASAQAQWRHGWGPGGWGPWRLPPAVHHPIDPYYYPGSYFRRSYAPQIGFYDASPHGVYYDPRRYHVEYYLPPLHEPAELQFGPRAVKQFMGVGRDFAMGPLLDRPTTVAKAVAPAEPRLVNARSRELAAKYVSYGDARFSAQQHHEAIQRYKTAAKLAPDSAEPWFKQALGYMANAKQEWAVNALKRGLALDDTWIDGDFRLDDLYEDTHAAKLSHLESLSRAVLDDPRDSDALCLLGVFLWFDGQRERSQKFFRRAIELTPKAEFIRPFLLKPDAERAPVEL
jgi:tetratricopeptide (TPR) repeat protein